MYVRLMRCICNLSAIFAICTTIATLALTIDERRTKPDLSKDPIPILFLGCRLIAAILATIQFMCSAMLFIKLKTDRNFWGGEYFCYTFVAICTTINYAIYSSLRSSYILANNQAKVFTDLSFFDVCTALNFSMFILFHLIVILDPGVQTQKIFPEATVQKSPAVHQGIFTVGASSYNNTNTSSAPHRPPQQLIHSYPGLISTNS